MVRKVHSNITPSPKKVTTGNTHMSSTGKLLYLKLVRTEEKIRDIRGIREFEV